MSIKKGQAIRYKKVHGGDGYGVIISTTKNSISFVEAKRYDRYSKCYDESGASYEKHRDNVRLKDCPAPFVNLSDGDKGGVYVVANIEDAITFEREQCEKYHVTVLDGGATISDRDMHEIFNHPWMDQKQKELKRSESIQKHNERIRDLDDKFGGVVNDTPDDELQL